MAVPHTRAVNRTTGVFDGEPDLAVRSKEIVRDAWASEEPRSA
ncbi:hypothetical protein [Kitasatospora sp. NPDC087315]